MALPGSGVDMPGKRFGFILLVALAVISLFLYSRLRYPRVIAESTLSACWSKDGRSLFYCTERHVFRYDARRRRSYPCDLPKGLLPIVPLNPPLVMGQRYISDLDVSPDGRKLVLLVSDWDGNRAPQKVDLYVADLTGRRSRHLMTLKGGGPVVWMKNGWIAYQDSLPGVNRVWLIRPDGSGRRRLRGVDIRFRAGDGSGFAYRDDDYRKNGIWHVYEAQTRRFITVKNPWKHSKDIDSPLPDMVFLSSRRTVLRVYNVRNRPLYRVVDLDTGQVGPVDLPGTRYADDISPDGKYAFEEVESSRVPLRLYVDALPDGVANVLGDPN